MFANPRSFSMTRAHLNCSLNNDHSSVGRSLRVAHRALREVWVWKSWWKSCTVPAGFPHIDVPFSNASDFKSTSHISVFIFCVLFFFAHPGGGYINDTYPAEEHLTPSTVYTTKTAYVPFSMVCTRLKGSCVLFLRSLNILRAFWKPVDWASLQSWANRLGHDFFVRRVSVFLFEIDSENKTFSVEPLRWTLGTR